MADETTHIVVNFEEREGTTISASGTLIEIDESSPSPLRPGMTAILNVFKRGSSVTVEGSAGSLSQGGSVVVKTTEQLVFGHDTEASFSKPMDSMQLWSWKGRSGGSPSFTEEKATLSVPTVGVLEVKYGSNATRYTLSCGSPMTVVVAAWASDGRKGSVTLTFTDEEATGAEAGTLIEVDSNSPSPLTRSSSALLNVFPKGASVQMFNSAGSLTLQSSGYPVEIEETVIFAGDTEASLQNSCDNLIDMHWVGNSQGGSPSIQGAILKCGVPTFGVLSIKYTTNATRYTLSSGVVGEVLVCATASDGRKGSVTLSFTEEEGEGEEEDDGSDLFIGVDIAVKDYCTDALVANATVEVDGAIKGQTGGDGTLYLGRYRKGTTHSLKITHANYIATDIDKLHNEEFTVPS